MKYHFLLLLLFGTFTTSTLRAQNNLNKAEKIKVWGNCGMCEERIEKAAKNAGATSADWNEDSKLLTVSYNPGKSNSFKIQQAVAQAGYDTQDLRGNDKAYEKLHGCCKYDRKVAEVKAEPKEIALHSCSGNCCK